MRCAGAVILASLFAFPVEAQQTAPAQQQVQVVECRDLATSGNYLGANETLINGKACRPAGTPLQIVESNPKPSSAPTEISPAPATSLPSDPSKQSVAEAKTNQTQPAPLTTNAVETPAPASASTTPAPAAAPVASKQAPEIPRKGVAFAVADSSGVHPGMPGWTQNWIRKNMKKYPGISFQQGRLVQGAQNYLIVLSASANAVSGFDPVVRTDTSTNITPVSGSGTVTDNYGSRWNYTYDGQVTTTTTTTTHENVPYTIESNTLYATVYDENGTMISQRWHVYSTKQGGDAANSFGYNLGNALSAINAKGRLVNAVVKDIEGKKKR
jgi:hypothetical protein